LKNKLFVFMLIFISLNTFVFARGNKQAESEKEKQNNEWVLCVTDFDVKSLPQSKLSVAGTITRKVVERFKEVSYRTRVSPEYAYYEGYAWYKARSEAAKKLSAKIEERSMLVYNGDAERKYKQSLAKADTEIEKLTAAFEEIDMSAPLINNEPVFKLTDGNITLAYPEPPKAGGEYKFCKDQKADAFLTGKIIDFHGRYNISIKLYAVYTKNVIHEDSIIFSPEDLESALDELTSKLILLISGSKPAAIAVKTEPKDALVLINKSFAGRGDMGTIERPPGKFEITSSANEHESITVETELKAGEIAEINIKLLPIDFVNIEIPETKSGAAVYHGALYLGEAPLTLRLPADTMEYINIESKDGLSGSMVFNTPPANGDSIYSLPVKTRKPPVKGKVERARSMYYWMWGGVWITGIAAWITYQTFLSSNNTLAYTEADRRDPDFVNKNYKRFETSRRAAITVGVVSVFWAVTLVRYLYIANRGSTPVVKPSKKK